MGEEKIFILIEFHSLERFLPGNAENCSSQVWSFR